jgi:hypothetical protein
MTDENLREFPHCGGTMCQWENECDCDCKYCAEPIEDDEAPACSRCMGTGISDSGPPDSSYCSQCRGSGLDGDDDDYYYDPEY